MSRSAAPTASDRPVVCIQGRGFVGTAIAVAVASARDDRGRSRFSVVGIDLPAPLGQERIDRINRGEFPFGTSDPALVEATAAAHAAGNVPASSDPFLCFIADAVEMIRRAAAIASCAGQVLNVGNQSPEVTIGDLAEVVPHTVGKQLTIDPKPATPGSPTRRCPDMSRMAELTGYCARFSLEEGVRRTYAWYRPMVFDGGETQVAT
jgi:hypothetical protein